MLAKIRERAAVLRNAARACGMLTCNKSCHRKLSYVSGATSGGSHGVPKWPEGEGS